MRRTLAAGLLAASLFGTPAAGLAQNDVKVGRASDGAEQPKIGLGFGEAKNKVERSDMGAYLVTVVAVVLCFGIILYPNRRP
jgi:hypothetical protein